MRISRVATGTFVGIGIALTATNPGCSSSSASGFGTEPGADGSTIVREPDGSIMVVPRDASVDTTTMLSNGEDSGQEATVIHEAGFNDAKVAVSDAACVPDAGNPGPGPVKHTCIIYPTAGDDNNECDGHHDPAGLPALANGTNGNGFDDNCNGLVDEGCTCTDVGTTKPCYLVPASQTVSGVPVGWCATNSKGTVACAPNGESGAHWSGTCRGAEPPYAEDVCAPGDFNCDGTAENPTGESCACKPSTITCPTSPLITVPYPPVSALPLEVNAAAWFSNPAKVSTATNWKWSMTGGDCDNIVPFPTFGLYDTADGSGAPISTTSTTLGSTMNEHGTVATGAGLSAVFPAFSLSGDYVLNASWTLNGEAYSCSVQIQARAPGLRAEGCWDTESQKDDLDLHMAKVNGFAQCATTHAWSDLACDTANEDCYYEECYGGKEGTYQYTDSVNWGFAKGTASDCVGWGSQTTGSCGNPRLDRDANGLSGFCDPTVVNPNGAAFCGPENINLDAPLDGDQYAVALRFYARHKAGLTANAHAHVNIYCDGVRVLSSGFDPTTTPPSEFPQLATGGENAAGDMWKVALVTTSVTGGVLTCTVAPTQSKVANATLDGTTAYCVDDASLNTANSQEFLTSGGGVPTTGNALCFH